MLTKKITLLLMIGFLLPGFTLSKKPEFHPPGTVPIVDNFFFDESERTNLDWREYLFWLQQNHGETAEEYVAAIPDSTVWSNRGGFEQPMIDNYFWHPAFDNYPVVGITHEQATAYCQWRTYRVREMIAANFANKPEMISYSRRMDYRLPSKTEWEMVSRLNDDNQSKLRLKKKNQKFGGVYNVKSSSAYTVPVHSYGPGTMGVYNMLGNVAEMVREKGVAKGGAFIHTEQEVLSGRDYVYEEKDYWLGFRCVCEITDK